MLTPEFIARVKRELDSGMSRVDVETSMRIAGLEPAEIANVFAVLSTGDHPIQEQALIQSPQIPASMVVTKMPDVPAQSAQTAPVATEVEFIAPSINPSAMKSPTPVAPVSTPPPASIPIAIKMPIAPPAPTLAPHIQPSAPPAKIMTPPKRSHHLGLLVGILFTLLIIVLAGGAGAYAYMQKIGPFAHPPYAQQNLISGLLDATSHIKSNAYKIQGSVTVVPRDADAEPFTIQVSNQDEILQKYANDSRRAQDVTSFLQYAKFTKPPFPGSLQTFANKIMSQYTYLKTQMHTTDPASNQPYQYISTDGGKNFTLTVTFETPAAIASIKSMQKYFGTTTSAVINGQTVTFNKSSSPYIYVAAEPPKPYLVQLGEMMRFLSPDISATLAASAQTDWSNEAGGWKSNLDATGNLGDLSYKVDVDTLKKGENYYFRINNLPDIFGFFSSAKGQWVEISATTSTTTDMLGGNEFSYLASELPKQEVKYKQDRQNLVAFVRKVAGFADEEGLVALKSPPSTDKVNGQVLYRYDFDINKNAILPFYKKMVAAAADDKTVNDYGLFQDPGTEEYLQSPEFNQVFDYLHKNSSITLWADDAGYPERITYTMRVVPPDTATQLAGKQVMLTIEVDLSDINQPVDIQAPANAKPVEDFEKRVQSNLDYSLQGARSNGRDARRIADLKQLQLALELYYNANKVYPPDVSKASLVTAGYISSIPTDPSTGKAYPYAALGTSAKCTGYHLGAVLEQTNSALYSDTDASPGKTCTGSARTDFNGKSLLCGATSDPKDQCYDVSSQ